MAKAQYLKQDYESALETLEYFEEDLTQPILMAEIFKRKKNKRKTKESRK